MGISVGGLNVLVNVGILFLAALAEHVLSRAIGNYSRVELFHRGKAKVVHDSDTHIWYLPVSCLKYRHNVGILLAVLTAAALVVSEILSEFGVESSRTCSPKWVSSDFGLCAKPFTGRSTDGEIAGISLFNQRVQWLDDNPIEAFYQGFSKLYNGTECLSCGGRGEPVVVAGCSVAPVAEFTGPGTLVGVVKTDKAFGTITHNITVEDTVVQGRGDITCNGDEESNPDTFCSSFIVSVISPPGFNSSRVNEIFMYTYHNREHAIAMLEKVRHEQNGTDVVEQASGRVTVEAITCDTNVLSIVDFVRAVQIFRTMQLEQTGRIYPRNEEGDGPRAIETRDIVLSVFGLKIIDQDACPGHTATFSECGVYNSIYLIPLGLTVAATIVLILVSHFLVKGSVKYVPRNSRTWYAFVKHLRGGGEPLVNSSPEIGREPERYRDWYHPRSYFRGLDDAILLRERHGVEAGEDGEDGEAGELDLAIEFGRYSSMEPWRSGGTTRVVQSLERIRRVLGRKSEPVGGMTRSSNIGGGCGATDADSGVPW